MLRNGAAYIERLNLLTASAEFSTPSGREEALKALERTIDSADLVYYSASVAIMRPVAGLDTMRKMWQRAMLVADVEPVVINEGGKRDRPARIPLLQQHANDPNCACLLGVVVQARRIQPAPMTFEALLASGLLFPTGALYHYFGPKRGGVSEAEALQTVKELEQDIADWPTRFAKSRFTPVN